MPSSDLILNVKQIAGYPTATSTGPNDDVVIQQGGLGGPYASMSPPNFVATALMNSGSLAVGLGLPADAAAGQILAGRVTAALGQTYDWNCYVSSPSNGFRVVHNGPSAIFGFGADGVFRWQAAPGAAAGATPALSEAMSLTSSGYLTVGDSVLLARDPVDSMEAATASWVSGHLMAAVAPLWGNYRTATVWSVNGRTGQVILGVSDIMSAGGAPIWSPNFQGIPTAPSPSASDNSAQIATTQWVWQAIDANVIQNTVLSFNGRSGQVVLTPPDVATAGAGIFAPIDSPAFSGSPTAPTAAPGTSTGELATTAFVMHAVTGSVTGVASFNTRTGAVVLTPGDVSGVGGAMLASPAFTGIPLAPTAAPGTSNTQIATTGFVNAAVAAAPYAPLTSPAFLGTPTAPTAALNTSTTQIATTAFVTAQIAAISLGVTSFDGRTGAVTLQANDISAAGGAVLASPAFTGTPTAPTAAPGTNTTQLATCQFVAAAIASMTAGVTTWNGRAGAVTLSNADVIAVLPASTSNPLANGTATPGTATSWSPGDHVHPTDATLAPLASPALTGSPTAPTATTGAQSTQIANTQFVANTVANYVPLAGGVLSGGIAFNMSGLSPLPPTSQRLGWGLFTDGSQDSSGWSPNGKASVPLASGSSSMGYMVRTIVVSGSIWPVHVIGMTNTVTQMYGYGPTANVVNWSVASCDGRVKQDVAPAKDGLSVVNSIPVHSCIYERPGVDFRERWDYTLIAQQVRDVLPFAYLEPPEGGYASLHPLHLIATLWRAVQQLTERVAALEGATL